MGQKPNATAKPEEKPAEKFIQYVRTKRKGGGWIAETVQVPVSLLESGAVKTTELWDWDLIGATERRVLNAAKESEPKR